LASTFSAFAGPDDQTSREDELQVRGRQKGLTVSCWLDYGNAGWESWRTYIAVRRWNKWLRFQKDRWPHPRAISGLGKKHLNLGEIRSTIDLLRPFNAPGD
jgi:hypothetical protein